MINRQIVEWEGGKKSKIVMDSIFNHLACRNLRNIYCGHLISLTSIKRYLRPTPIDISNSARLQWPKP